MKREEDKTECTAVDVNVGILQPDHLASGVIYPNRFGVFHTVGQSVVVDIAISGFSPSTC